MSEVRVGGFDVKVTKEELRAFDQVVAERAKVRDRTAAAVTAQLLRDAREQGVEVTEAHQVAARKAALKGVPALTRESVAAAHPRVAAEVERLAAAAADRAEREATRAEASGAPGTDDDAHVIDMGALSAITREVLSKPQPDPAAPPSPVASEGDPANALGGVTAGAPTRTDVDAQEEESRGEPRPAALAIAVEEDAGEGAVEGEEAVEQSEGRRGSRRSR